MRRKLDRRLTIVLPALLAGVLLVAAPAAAQNVNAAVDDLQDNDVTYEQGALTDDDLDELDDAAQDLQDDAGFFKIVVLSDRVEGSTTRSFAGRVLDGLGGNGRVLVYDPASVGIASNVDPPAEVAAAENAVIEEANRTNSYADGALAGGEVLIGEDVGDDGGGGGGAWLFWLLLLGGGLLLVLLLVSRSRKRAREQAGPSGAVFGEGEAKVRGAVDRSANLVLELSDPIEAPDAPPRAKALYQEGARRFMELQEPLEEADTHAELEAVWPKLVATEWSLSSAKAVLEGAPEPPQPTPAPLFREPEPLPEPATVPVPAPAQEPGYRGFDASPWLTTAATMAMSVLLSRGMGGGGQTYQRSPMPDDMFGDLFGRGGFDGGGWGGGGGGTRRRPRISLGRGGRGMGSR